jgi:hypothetical protein
VLYEVPTYLAECSIGNENRKTKRKKAMGKYIKIPNEIVSDFGKRLRDKSKIEDREFIKKQQISLIKAKKIIVK